MAVSPGFFDGDDEALDARPFADINVTPLVDVMLVLLVVFMMAAPLMVQGVPIELPKNAGASLGRPARPVILSLTRDGSLYLRDEKLDRAELAGRLHALHTNEGDAIVYVRADRAIAYGEVMDVIGRFRTSGFTHVSLLSQPGPAGP